MSFVLCCDVNTEEMDNHSCGALGILAYLWILMQIEKNPCISVLIFYYERHTRMYSSIEK